MCVPSGVLAMSTPPYPALSNWFWRNSLISVFLTDSVTKCLTTDILLCCLLGFFEYEFDVG